LYKLLSNPIYVGQIRHRGVCFPGQHQPIVNRELWEQTQRRLIENATKSRGRSSTAESSLLIGKLFDELGAVLTPSHTAKRGRRYRYYVSRSLLRGETQKTEGWRLPAPEIEKVVTNAVRETFLDQKAIVTAVQKSDVDASRLPRIFHAAADIAHRLDQEGAREVLRQVLERAKLLADGLEIVAKIPEHQSARGPSGETTLQLNRFLPMRIRRRGVEMRLVLGAGASRTRQPDPALLKAVARGRGWFQALVGDRARSIADIAKLEKMSGRVVRRFLRLAFLAPEIVEAIAAGAHPPELTAQTLLHRFKLSLDWPTQLKSLGME
jgi:hypothetical protein